MSLIRIRQTAKTHQTIHQHTNTKKIIRIKAINAHKPCWRLDRFCSHFAMRWRRIWRNYTRTYTKSLNNAQHVAAVSAAAEKPTHIDSRWARRKLLLIRYITITMFASMFQHKNQHFLSISIPIIMNVCRITERQSSEWMGVNIVLQKFREHHNHQLLGHCKTRKM